MRSAAIGAGVVGFTSVITYPQGLAVSRKLTVVQAVEFLAEHGFDFKGITIRVAARKGKIRDAELMSKVMWLLPEDGLLEWASNEAIHKPGKRSEPPK